MPSAHVRELIEFTDRNVGELQCLIDESKRIGYNFLQRTIDDWYNGVNKFDKPGEKLWGLFIGKDLIGVGGLNKIPIPWRQGLAGCGTCTFGKLSA